MAEQAKPVCNCYPEPYSRRKHPRSNPHNPHNHLRSCPLWEGEVEGWDYPPPVADLDAYTERATRTGDWSWRR